MNASGRLRIDGNPIRTLLGMVEAVDIRIVDEFVI